MAKPKSPKSPRKPGGGRPRAALNEEKILRCAMRVADEEGIDAVSMRTVAGKLGVEAMSLYNHVGGKDQILSGIVDLVVAEIDVPVGGSDWRASMRRRAVSAHEVLLRHPWASALIESRASQSPIRLRYADSVLGILRQAGFSIEMAYNAFLTLDSYVYGFTLQEVSWVYPPDQVKEVVARLRPQVPAADYPHVTEIMEFVAQREAPSPRAYEAEFAFGLDLILDGLARAVAGSRESG
jgi:AcrR family transcriptional regulator